MESDKAKHGFWTTEIDDLPVGVLGEAEDWREELSLNYHLS